jgi:hypothetical protein
MDLAELCLQDYQKLGKKISELKHGWQHCRISSKVGKQKSV